MLFVFYVLCFASCAFMEEGECGCFVYPNLEDELASYAILVFVLHDVFMGVWFQLVDWIVEG